MTAKHDHLQYNTFSKKKNDQKEGTARFDLSNMIEKHESWETTKIFTKTSLGKV